MSTDREFVDDRYDAPDDPDPYGIVPNDFIQNWGGPEVTTIAGALRVAEQAPSTTDPAEMDRCPECGSVKLRSKPGATQANSREGSTQCVRCKAHLTDPLPPRAAFDVAEPVCPGCRSWRLRTRVGGGVTCLDCGGEHEAAAEGAREDGQLALDEVAE